VKSSIKSQSWTDEMSKYRTFKARLTVQNLSNDIG